MNSSSDSGESLSNKDCIKKIYPTITELSVINNYVKCTEENCEEIFTSHSNLNLHLYKTHKKKDAIQFDSIIKQFHCPDVQCIYNQLQWFKNKKLLKQHYLKVHSPKTYACVNCQEGFPTKAFKNMHEDYCGVKFKCSECPVSYPKYESLLTHARRKEHKISDKINFKLNKLDKVVTVNRSKSDSYVIVCKERLILPKPPSSVQLNTNLKLTHKTSDQSIQTDHIQPKLKSKVTQMNSKSSELSRGTQQTQTGLWKERSSIETQTIGDFSKRESISYDVDKKFITKQSSTQTNEMLSKSVSSNTFYPSNNIELPALDVKRSTSSTQTLKLSKDSFPASCAVNTDTSDLIANNLGSFDSNFFNCNMETQTDLIFNEDLFSYGDYYSNMYTQTCEDLFLNSLELNHIETQTVDDMLKSVEIQTLPHRKPQMSCRDISHMETQTDLEFKEILEAINA